MVIITASSLDRTTSRACEGLVTQSAGACVKLRRDGVDGAVVTVTVRRLGKHPEPRWDRRLVLPLAWTTPGLCDDPVTHLEAATVGDAAIRAAFLLMRSRAGEPVDEHTVHRHVSAAGGAEEITRALGVLIGALGGLIIEGTRTDPGADPGAAPLGDAQSDPGIDPASLVASGLRRYQQSEVVGPDTLPLAAGVLTAAFMTGSDPLTWLDEIGPRPAHGAPLLEVLNDLAALIDTVQCQDGFALQLIGSVLDEGS